MSQKLRRVFVVVLSVALVLCILAASTAVWLPRRSFAKVDGRIQLTGLDLAVDVYRDSFGIPYIYAQSAHDLFFAQGYIHAQDRFWQMDFWRHLGSARLSEMFGADQLDTDRFLRTLGWARVAQQEWEALDAETRQALQAYADGVNAYLADHRGTALSLEYAVLKLLTPSYQPEPWQPLHSLTWGKAMAWNLGDNMSSEIQRALLLKTLSPQQLAEIDPPYPSDHPVIVPDFQVAGTTASQQTSGRAALASLAPLFEELAGQMDELRGVLGPVGDWIGSNNWVIGGSRTATGLPLLADDMHLPSQMPSIWYENALFCIAPGAECPYQVTGFSFPGAPGVVVGHNNRLAWGFTNVGPDVQDLYIEKINPQNPDQYEVNGQWVDMQIIDETILVGSKQQEALRVRLTRHGPVISGVYAPLDDFETESGLSLPDHYAIALRWTALEPGKVFEAILGFNRAQNWDEFRQAARDFAAPAQNIVYADVDGNIAYQMPGNIPIRKTGHSGELPVPGWTDDYEWLGYIPFEQHPYTLNPEAGYIASANNAVVGQDYPYSITTRWDYGYRAQRIVEMIEQAPGPVTAAYIQQMHGDNKDLNAETLMPILLDIPLDDSHLTAVRELLRGWDFQDQMDLAAPALYNAFWQHLLARAFQDDLPERYWPGGGSRWFEVMRHLVQQPDSAWWDDSTTSVVESRDQIFASAFKDAVDELEASLGKNPDGWTWGDLHILVFRNQTLGMSGIAPIEALFNRGPYRASGSDSVVNATGWSAKDPYQVVGLPSMRMIVDLQHIDQSLSINTTGQSGHAYHRHYVDMADLYRKIQYHPMLWTRDQVLSADLEGHLVLEP